MFLARLHLKILSKNKFVHDVKKFKRFYPAGLLHL